MAGHFGEFGGQYVPDTLMPALHQLEQSYGQAQKDPEFHKHLSELRRHYVGRPTPLYFAKRLSETYGYPIYLKREDLNHTGAHKINNSLGQALLAQRMGKKRIIAETGAGQHGVATATACALLGLECVVYMGDEDMRRQALNVYRMQLLGATVVGVSSGSKTLKDATTEAIRDWMGSVETTHYIIGSVVGPHPFPSMVRDFQSVIGEETRDQIMERENRLPDAIMACVGGGSNAMGMFYPFIEDTGVRLIGVEAAGKGLQTSEHAAALAKGTPGILHGSKSYLLQSEEGQIQLAHSVSAGLDYPGVGPQLSYLKSMHRLEIGSVTDDEAVTACRTLALHEGIIPALETAHAIAYLTHFKLNANQILVLCLSGRGDKDMETLRQYEQA